MKMKTYPKGVHLNSIAWFPNQVIEYFHYPKKFLFAPFQSSTALTQKPLFWFLSPYLNLACSCIFYKWHLIVHTCVWLLLLWIIFLRFIYVTVWTISSLLLWKSCYEHFYQSFCVHVLYSSWCSTISFLKKRFHIQISLWSHTV